MHSKIKEIRMRLGLSETQISSLLNISSYKYRRYENGSLTISVEVLILLSIMYDISIDLFVFDRISVNLIFEEKSIKKILQFSEEKRVLILESNMCKYCAYSCNSINYRVVKNMLAKSLSEFSKKLQYLRCSQLLEISEISALLKLNVEYYMNLERGKIWPSVYDLVGLSTVFMKPVNELLGIKNETDKL